MSACIHARTHTSLCKYILQSFLYLERNHTSFQSILPANRVTVVGDVVDDLLIVSVTLVNDHFVCAQVTQVSVMKGAVLS